MSPLFQTLAATLATVAVALSLLWLVSVVLRDASIVDAFWGSGFALVALVAAGLNAPPDVRTGLLVVLTCVWGLRLSLFLLWRNWGQGEDRRYRAMRERIGPSFWWVSLFSVFLLQAGILWFVSLPVQAAAAAAPSPLDVLDAVGTLLWGVGLLFEAVGDWQLARFKSKPENQGQVMEWGLWRYTRHPNYFGDFCVWWGLYLIAVAAGAWWTVLSPLLMSFLLMRISGVTLLERTITERRPGYAEYQARTNAFFPGPPRKQSVVGAERA